MFTSTTAPAERQAQAVAWAACVGAVTAEALAVREGSSIASARAALSVATRAGLLLRCRPLAERPALFTPSRAGLKFAGAQGVDPATVTAATAAHLIACAEVAAALEHLYQGHSVSGERWLRREERERGRPVASARLGEGPDGTPLLHRPDLVMWPPVGDGALPVSVEVELTIKSQRRLQAICLAWARARCVAGVMYVAPSDVGRALSHAIEKSRAADRIVVVGVDALLV